MLTFGGGDGGRFERGKMLLLPLPPLPLGGGPRTLPPECDAVADDGRPSSDEPIGGSCGDRRRRDAPMIGDGGVRRPRPPSIGGSGGERGDLRRIGIGSRIESRGDRGRGARFMPDGGPPRIIS